MGPSLSHEGWVLVQEDSLLAGHETEAGEWQLLEDTADAARMAQFSPPSVGTCFLPECLKLQAVLDLCILCLPPTPAIFIAKLNL